MKTAPIMEIDALLCWCFSNMQDLSKDEEWIPHAVIKIAEWLREQSGLPPSSVPELNEGILIAKKMWVPIEPD